MKRIILPILCLLSITSCSKEIFTDQLVVRNGLSYEVNSQKPYSGKVVSYWPNGQLNLSGNYINGKFDGCFESFFDNGDLMAKGCRVNGLREGLFLQSLSGFPGGSFERKCFKNNLKVDISYCEK